MRVKLAFPGTLSLEWTSSRVCGASFFLCLARRVRVGGRSTAAYRGKSTEQRKVYWSIVLRNEVRGHDRWTRLASCHFTAKHECIRAESRGGQNRELCPTYDPSSQSLTRPRDLAGLRRTVADGGHHQKCPDWQHGKHPVVVHPLRDQQRSHLYIDHL